MAPWITAMSVVKLRTAAKRDQAKTACGAFDGCQGGREQVVDDVLIRTMVVAPTCARGNDCGSAKTVAPSMIADNAAGRRCQYGVRAGAERFWTAERPDGGL